MFYQPAEIVLDVAVPPLEFQDTVEEPRVTELGESTEIGESTDSNESSGERETENEDSSIDSDDDEEDPNMPPLMTRSGRAVNQPTRLIKEIGAAATGIVPETEAEIYEIKLTDAEKEYYDTMQSIHEGEFINDEIVCVGAGIGGGFVNTNELKVLKYKDAMKTADWKQWEKAADEEHDRMVKHNVWLAILRRDIPMAAKIITSTWAMKKKANGTYRARLNARGYEQVDGVHYDSHSISAPVTNDVTIHIVLVLLIMAKWAGELVDIKGAFLHGDFEDGKNLYMEVPEGFDKYYDPMYYVLLLLQTIYGLKQSAMAFWRQLLKAFRSMGFKRSKADPCLYFAWTLLGLVLWISWIDDCLVVGKAEGVKKAKRKLTNRFDCDEVGNMDEYVGCKLERNYVLLQSFTDKFDLPNEKSPCTPAEAGSMITACKPEDAMSEQLQNKYRSGVGKLLHMMRWSRPELLNSVRECSKAMKTSAHAHLKTMYRIMNYCVATPNRGLLLKPVGTWNGDRDFEFEIEGYPDANYATNIENRRSVSGYSVFMCKAPVSMKSGGQKSVTLSTAESELASVTQCVQDMLYVLRILELIELKVKKPMQMYCDNKGAVDLANNWSVGGRTRHIAVRQYFLRELKEEGLIHMQWISGDDMPSDLFTKNLPAPLFEKHASRYVGIDEYMNNLQCNPQDG
jgi:histone deacetylase 1/2